MKKNLFNLALVFLMSTFSCVAYSADPVELDYEQQRLDVRFRLFKTKNTWNFLELDTQTGQVWQIQYSLKEDGRFKLPIIKDSLAQNGKIGRFTMHPTRNMFNFVLLDQESGKVWQVQWSTGLEAGYWPIDIAPTQSEWKK